MKAIKIAAVIPARLASSRFPRKVLYDFCGLPMLEHVRKRAEISKVFNAGVYVATCDQEVFDLLSELILDFKEQNNLKKIETLEKKLINNLDESSFSELIKLKSQLNRD